MKSLQLLAFRSYMFFHQVWYTGSDINL